MVRKGEEKRALTSGHWIQRERNYRPSRGARPPSLPSRGEFECEGVIEGGVIEEVLHRDAFESKKRNRETE